MLAGATALRRVSQIIKHISFEQRNEFIHNVSAAQSLKRKGNTE